MALFPFVTEQLIPEPEAREITRPYWEELTAVWISAWEAWRRIEEGDRARLGETPCTPPVVLNAFAQSYARGCFSGREDEGLIECREIPNVFAFYVHSRVLLRFNTLCPDFVVRNTEKSALKEAYFRQEPIAGIDDSATRLTVGYVPNEPRTDAACIAISLQFDHDPVYHFRIDGRDEGTLPIPAPTVAPPPMAPSEQLRTRKPR